MRKITALLLTLVLVFSFSVTAMAKTVNADTEKADLEESGKLDLNMYKDPVLKKIHEDYFEAQLDYKNLDRLDEIKKEYKIRLAKYNKPFVEKIRTILDDFLLEFSVAEDSMEKSLVLSEMSNKYTEFALENEISYEVAKIMSDLFFKFGVDDTFEEVEKMLNEANKEFDEYLSIIPEEKPITEEPIKKETTKKTKTTEPTKAVKVIKTVKSPQTGDNASLILMSVSVLVLALASAYILKKKSATETE